MRDLQSGAKRRVAARRIALAASLAAVVAVPTATIAAQAVVPVTLDHESKHHVVLTNSWMRLLNVVVPPGDSTLYHVHSNDYAYVTFGGVALKAQALGDTATNLVLTNGEVRFTKAPITHRVVNPSASPFHNLTIELLKSSGVPLAPATDPVVLENDRVRVERIVLEPGQSDARHEHRGPWLDVGVAAGTVTDVDDHGSKRIEFRPASYVWHDAARTHTLTNVGRTRVEIVEVEWK